MKTRFRLRNMKNTQPHLGPSLGEDCEDCNVNEDCAEMQCKCSHSMHYEGSRHLICKSKNQDWHSILENQEGSKLQNNTIKLFNMTFCDITFSEVTFWTDHSLEHTCHIFDLCYSFLGPWTVRSYRSGWSTHVSKNSWWMIHGDLSMI